MSTGTLKVEVSSGNQGTPVVAARVRITGPDGVTVDALTDASGVVQGYTQETPDISLSYDPDYDGDVYSTCDVEVSAYKYRTVVINGVQIYPNQTMLLPVELEPIDISAGNPQSNEPNVIDEPPNHINDRDHEDLDPPPEGISPQVLDKVVVPEFITVHLGRPTQSAQDVTVTFRYYIKNVCCSEIYPTWPEASLRANILCEISLALNRIFTEWYRSRGYEFDITNSTSYDQYFVNGREIAENVSQIVDEIFDNYARREGFIEPYYTEYCNGTTVTCPGLKQWGTVTLAEQGMTPLQILQYYYGSNITISEAAAVKGVPSSYPGASLTIGSSGDAVTTLQTELNRIRQNYPLIPAVTVDGKYGAGTAAAVKVFQSIFDLTQDGITGKATWYKISYVYVAVKRLAELGSEGIAGGESVPPNPGNSLTVGAIGADVKLAQFMLNIAASFYSSLAPVTVDGVFGNATAAAVRAFQSMRGITADGVIGPTTWSNLYDVYYNIFNTIETDPSYPGTALRVGSSGANVSTLQRYLNYINTNFGIYDAITVDGKFGNGTAAAVKAFQAKFGLDADGVVGPKTWTELVKIYNSISSNISI